VILQCVWSTADDGERYEQLVEITSARGVRAHRVWYSPAGRRVAVQRVGPWNKLHVVRIEDVSRYIRSHGAGYFATVPRGRHPSCGGGHSPEVEVQSWIDDDILRYTLGSCDTVDIYDYCASSGVEMLVQRAADGSDTGRARRRARPPDASPCPQ
jgi:hypothetical protein